VKTAIRFVILLLAGSLLLPLPALATPGPTDQVRETIDKVLDILRDKKLPDGERRTQLSSLIRSRFDFALMSQWTLGQYWRKATDEQQKRFIGLYSDLLEESYLSKIEKYTDEKVAYLSEKVEDGRAEVATQIETASANIPLTYRLSLEGDRWMVFDVVIEEVSLVRNYRSTFGEIARKDGIDGLLKQVAEKVEEQKAARNGKTP